MRALALAPAARIVGMPPRVRDFVVS